MSLKIKTCIAALFVLAAVSAGSASTASADVPISNFGIVPSETKAGSHPDLQFAVTMENALIQAQKYEYQSECACENARFVNDPRADRRRRQRPRDRALRSGRLRRLQLPGQLPDRDRRSRGQPWLLRVGADPADIQPRAEDQRPGPARRQRARLEDLSTSSTAGREATTGWTRKSSSSPGSRPTSSTTFSGVFPPTRPTTAPASSTRRSARSSSRSATKTGP